MFQVSSLPARTRQGRAGQGSPGTVLVPVSTSDAQQPCLAATTQALPWAEVFCAVSTTLLTVQLAFRAVGGLFYHLRDTKLL